MYPFLLPEIFQNYLPLYDMLIIFGVFLMVIYIAWRFEKQDGLTRKQASKLVVLILVSLVVALFSSYFIDGLFHSIKEGKLSFGSVSFLGGLVGGVFSMMILLKYFYKDNSKNVKTIMNTILTGVVLAHAFGRVGCFLAGCCFGIPTDSFLGVVFPYGHAHNTFGDTAIFPTQLFEAFFLFGLFAFMNTVRFVKGFEVETYLIGYGVFRIFNELIRGDDRGSFMRLFTTEFNVFPTPSQFISLLMIILAVVIIIRKRSGNMAIN